MLVILARRRKSNDLAKFGLTLFVAGGASNWIDRIMRGSVVDFLNVGVGPVRTGIFNVADVAIVLGNRHLYARGVPEGSRCHLFWVH